MSMRVDELKGMEVENRNGEDIGEVENVVLDPQTNTLHAVLGVGGVLGLGEKSITLQLDEMELRGDKLIALTGMSEKELDSRPAYDASNYRKLEDDQVLADAVSAGSGQPGSASFTALDQNSDNHISRDEAQQNQALRDEWQRIDTNNDQRIDRAEFSAFEQTSN
jgi:hypothetical protein